MGKINDKLKSNVGNFKSRYLGYEVAWFFDFLQKNMQVNKKINYTTLRLQFHYHIFDNDSLYKHFDHVYGKNPNELDNNYTGFILVAGYKTLFSLVKEILKQKEFKTFLINKFGEEVIEKMDILYSFLRNFWVHNMEQDFGIQKRDYENTYKYMKNRSRYCRQGKLDFKFVYKPIINVAYKIDFNNIQGKAIFDVVSIKEHLSLIHVFYNFCSLYEDSISNQN